MTGGVSAQVTAVEIELPDGTTRKLVVRRYGETDSGRDSPTMANEFRLMQAALSAGIPAPAPYYCDQSGVIFSTPFLVMEYVEGDTVFAPSEVPDIIPRLATQLASINRIDPLVFNLDFLPRQEEVIAGMLANRPTQLDESLAEGRIRDALGAVWPLHQHNRLALLHGDYWPGNILWRDGTLVAVLDWEDAAVGDPLADLANSRLEILWAFGMDATLDFTRYYLSLVEIDTTKLPYWDLYAALRPAGKLADWAVDADEEKMMRERHRLFVERAFKKLSANVS